MAKHNLGMVTAYAYAVAGGYTGTEAEFETLLGNIATDLEEIENLTVTATTLPEGSSATASYSDGVLTLGIPKGDTGATGAGATATAGTTTTGNPGTNASVVNSGTTKDAVFDFTIPRGDTGNGIESIYLTGTSGAVHTYTILFTDGNTTTFDVTDGEVTNAALTAILADYAKTDGAYESMTVGNAEQLISSVYVTDEEPYQFRTSGGSIDIGDRETDKIIGGTVAWNQMIIPYNLFAPNGATMSISDNVITLTANSTGVANSRVRISNSVNASAPIGGHKYLMCASVKPSVALTSVGIYFGNHLLHTAYALSANVWTDIYAIKTHTNPGGHYYQLDCNGTFAENDTVQIKGYMQFDLTQMFGSTIADYIYSLEQGQAGAGVAFFRKYFPKPYYPYDAGTIKSVEGVSAHKTVGFNAWDEEWESGYIEPTTGSEQADSSKIRMKNYMRVIPNTTYYKKAPNGFWNVYFDADKKYIGYGDAGVNQTFTTPSNAHYIRSGFEAAYGTTYKNDICINLSWDGERNGEYEPYVEHSYPLDDSLTLRGIPKIANGKLYYDGDAYESDGTVTRRVVAVDLGSLTWVKSGSTTGGFTGTLSIPYRFANNLEMICSKYVFDGAGDSSRGYYGADGTIRYFYGGGTAYYEVYVHDTNYSSASASDFKTAMSGVYLVYELATPTTETADTFVNPQIVDDFGTEEYVTTSIVPVGHETKYTNNLKAKLEMSPESPSGDGDYIVRQTSGTNEYVPLGSTTTISNIITRLEALENA